MNDARDAVYTTMESIISIAKDVNREVEGDYRDEDGLLRCGKCKARKEMRIPDYYPDFMRIGDTLPVMCECAKEKKHREEAAKDAEIFAARVRENTKDCFSDPRMAEWTIENDDGTNPRVMTIVRNYVDKFDEIGGKGKGLLFYGTYGTGKTYAACMIVNALLQKGKRCLVTNFATVLNKLQSTYDKQEYIDSIVDHDLIVVDDLGIERETEYAREQVFGVIDAIYRSGHPLIVTTNLGTDEMKNPRIPENRRIYDRILERCFPLKFDGESRRRRNGMDQYAEMKEMLGI